MSERSDPPKVYLVRGGRSGEDEEYVIQNNLAIIGFHEVPSLKAPLIMTRYYSW